ncbi:MAG TPA: class I poly(R)-hydroxyalkanoic acid synthase [Rhodospirillaceae bacterium]|nr:class I poly(R)-hydroxyalkanoic acid synthase [Rhodospirillaceae bacterium]
MSKPDQDEAATRRFTAEITELAEKYRRILQQQGDWMADDDGFRVMHPMVIGKAFQEMMTKALEEPRDLIRDQVAYWTKMGEVWQRAARRVLAEEPVDPVVTPAPEDRRFKNDAWTDGPGFDLLKQVYLLTAGHIQSSVGKVRGLDEHTRKKLSFYTRQFVDAMSPANFALTNPEVLNATVESRGENLVKGMNHLLEDIERGRGHWSLKLTDLEGFKVGETLAVTPGKVVFQNEMMQLVQYTPTTETVRQRPLLIVPPWINKFYILDLRPQNSFIRWAVAQGHTVFLISWVNPDKSHAGKTFEEYMKQGPLTALDVICEATGEKKVNAIGYCIGGTLMGVTLGYMAAKRDRRIASITFFTSLLDFSDTGEISVFIDEEQISLMEEHMNRVGYLEGHHLADAFSMLRDNDLIWSFVIRNYLLGREPMPFDILYWNSDSTHMPAAMHSFYLRNMYQKNLLSKPGGITIGGVPIDLGKIKIPTYYLSTREDHIAPWKSTYTGARLLAGPVTFVLGGSGHVAGVVNPPPSAKYGYWTHDGLPESPDDWLAAATPHEGSWWGDWDGWVTQFGGKRVPARQPGDAPLAAIEDAPGSYVKMRIS